MIDVLSQMEIKLSRELECSFVRGELLKALHCNSKVYRYKWFEKRCHYHNSNCFEEYSLLFHKEIISMRNSIGYWHILSHNTIDFDIRKRWKWTNLPKPHEDHLDPVKRMSTCVAYIRQHGCVAVGTAPIYKNKKTVHLALKLVLIRSGQASLKIKPPRWKGHPHHAYDHIYTRWLM